MASRKKATRSPDRSKASLIVSGRKLFAARGFHGATVKQIADDAGLNVCLLSHYFDGKEGLYRACLEGFGEVRRAALERVLEAPRSAEEFRVRLEMFLLELLEFHL